MNTTQIPFLVEGVLILACGIFGILLMRAGKPYGRVKLILHLFLYAWLTTGFVFIIPALFTTNVMKMIWIPIGLVCLTLLTQLGTGIIMIVSKNAGSILPKIHLSSAILMFISVICASIIAGFH